MMHRLSDFGAGDELLKRATCLEIKLYRTTGGKVEAHFELSGMIGEQVDDEEETFTGTVCRPNDIRFIGDLSWSSTGRVGQNSLKTDRRRC